MVRVVTRNLWRRYFSETDDPTADDEQQLVNGLPVDPLNDKRLMRLVARTFREQQQEIDAQQQEINALKARVAVLEGKVP